MTAIPRQDPTRRKTVEIGESPIRLEDVVEVSEGRANPVLSANARLTMKASAEVVRERHKEGTEIYGLTTSVGASVDTSIARDDAGAFSTNLVRMHGVGSGRILGDVETAAVLVNKRCVY